MSYVKGQNKSNLENKLFTVCRKDYKRSHIKLDPRLCRDCSSRICTRVCPAEVYEWDEAEGQVKIRYENCLECGSCWIACEMQNIEWRNPIGGSGIIYKHS